MGYRSTFITDDWNFKFSDEFVEKYKERYNFGRNNTLPISSKSEFVRFWDNLEEDIVKEMNLKNSSSTIFGIWLHEDGQISRIIFSKEGVSDYVEFECCPKK